ncbi:MAG: Uma2 family endonuclease [Planctomycetes bacterium]|nr:Uma2 family endonuclease [Planctomycetota bacterium]
MRAVQLCVSEAELRERHARGLDRFDEMWEGELHMVPPPSFEHQDMATELSYFFRLECRRLEHGRVVAGAGLHDPQNPEKNYRAPDLTFVAAGNEKVISRRGIVGAADAVIELRSPDDETYEKFPFFARLGVRQVVVIDSENRRPEVYRLSRGRYVAVVPSKEGWLTAEVLRIRLRHEPRRRCVRVVAVDDPKRFVVL